MHVGGNLEKDWANESVQLESRLNKTSAKLTELFYKAQMTGLPISSPCLDQSLYVRSPRRKTLGWFSATGAKPGEAVGPLRLPAENLENKYFHEWECG